MRGDVLVLDDRYQPLGRVHWTRAITLYIEGQVEIVEKYADKVIRSAKESWPMPAVIRWLKHVKRKWVHEPRFSREAVFLRDEGRCQYCGRAVPMAKFTLDHVVPKSRGGLTAWDNIVVSCSTCNTRKKDRTPDEAGMALKKAPEVPKKRVAYYAVLKKRKQVPREWKSWLLYADWIDELFVGASESDRHDVCTT